MSLLPHAPAQKKWMLIKLGHTSKPRKVTWYDPCEPSALDTTVRATFGIAPSQPFLLLDDTMSVVALSASLPSGGTFELVVQAQPPCLEDERPAAIAIIDPISTGAVLAKRVHDLGYAVVRVWSDVVPEDLRSFVDPRAAFEFIATVQHNTDSIGATCAQLKALDIDLREVMVGCETGVLLGDALSEGLGLRGNGTAKSSLRRNKFLQTEALRQSGLNACGQRLADSAADVEAFLMVLMENVTEKPVTVPFKAVVKPVEGAGSDGVFICNSEDEVRKAYASLEGTKNVLGLTNYSVLLQEYLRGDEYVVDTVSRSGVHKCVAIWKYDKRMCNGSPVVYFGVRLMPIDSEPGLRAMVEYVFGVLEALGIRNGAVHSEVKTVERGPVLIEANCRLHGGEGTWAPMAEACTGGYSQISAMIDSYIDPAAFAALPYVPSNFVAHCTEANMQSFVAGTLVEIDPEALKKIRSLSSYTNEFLDVTEGKRIEKTIDLLTSCGNFNLINESKLQLDADYAEFHRIVHNGGHGIFRVE